MDLSTGTRSVLLLADTFVYNAGVKLGGWTATWSIQAIKAGFGNPNRDAAAIPGGITECYRMLGGDQF